MAAKGGQHEPLAVAIHARQPTAMPMRSSGDRRYVLFWFPSAPIALPTIAVVALIIAA